MSYILDALKKAEAQSDPDTAVRLSLAEEHTRRNRWLWGLAGAALALNAAVVIWLFTAGPGSVQSSTIASPPAGAPGGSKSAEPTPPGNPPPASIAAPTPASFGPAALPGQAAVANAEPQPAGTEAGPDITRTPPVTGPPPAAVRTVAVTDLTGPSRQVFADLDISTHIYASDPTFRALVVNGHRMEEGQLLPGGKPSGGQRSTDGLRLIAVTEQGAVFEYQGERVEIPVLADWEAEREMRR